MRQIPIGSCIPGGRFTSWVPFLKDKGYECFTVNFHMAFGNVVLEDLARDVHAILDGTGIPVSALGFYCNALANEEHEKQLHHVIDMAAAFGTNIVSTFAGALPDEPVPAAIPRFKQVFGELARHAEDKGVRLAIENCPMGGNWEKATCNIGFNPRAWDMMFDAVSSDALGLEWEPTHQMIQLIDPISCLRRYVGKVFHIHGKDAIVNRDLLEQQGLLCGEPIVDSRFPGFGDTDWRKVFAILHKADYDGMVSIEGRHDAIFHGEWETTGERHALNYLKWARGGDFIPNPWE